MFRRNIIILCVALYCVVFATIARAQLPQISSGLSYLTSSQNSDGTWATSTAKVETTAATVSVLETLKLLNQTSGAPFTAGVSWLQVQTPQSVEYIALRLNTLGLADVSSLTPSADLIKGGWGGDVGYETNQLDTSVALQALKAANHTDITIINTALAYLTGSQNPDGGWGFSSGDPSADSGQADSNVYMTALVSATLQQFPQMTSISTAVNKATTYLLAHQNPDGGFGSVYETALAYSALVAVSTNNAALANAINYLITTQSVSGSWNDDPYSTALALKALYLSENKPVSPPPPPAGGTITGTVIDKITGQNLTGVAVVLDSNNLVNTTTDVSGNFTLANIPAGAQKVNFSLTGYAATSGSATIVIDATANLGTIPMTSSYSTGTIAGTITDSSGKPLADVAITISGVWSGSTITGADGSYSFSYVTPGSVTLSASKSGFQAATAPGTVYARTTLLFSPRMNTTASQATTGILVGRVVETSGLPLDHLPGEEGVTVTVSGGLKVAVDADNGGYFTIPNLAPGTYLIIVGMHGFASHVFQAVIMPGVTTDLGTIRLAMTVSKMTLTGKVTDAKSGRPVSGAEITISGTGFTGRTDFNGTYAIAEIPTPVEYTVKISADGYVGKSYTIGSSPWTQTMDIALTPQETKGGLSGTVIDAATGQPLPGVVLTLATDQALTATTDTNGVFTLTAVPNGVQQVTLALSGYTTRSLTTAIVAGVTTNAGKLPLSVTTLPASIQGTVWDGIANTPFAGVTIQTSGSGSLQTVSATDGTYQLADVPPGTVTVSANPLARPGYYEARFTGQLEPGGLLVFNPTLTTTPPSVVDVTVLADKTSYLPGDTAGITVKLQNKETSEYSTVLHLRVTDPSGTVIFDTDMPLALPEDGTVAQLFNVLLPGTVQGGNYTIKADLFDAGGKNIGTGQSSFGVAASQITVTPTLPATFAVGDNTVLFNLGNLGTLAVATGVLDLTLKDPDGQVVSHRSQPFGLGLEENKSLAVTLSVPALKFGTYTLSYTQSDESKTGQPVSITLSNSVTVSAVFDNNSHRVRETAGLTVTITNTGRFNLDTLSVAAAVPDAGYEETKSLTPAPAVGSTVGSTILYHFVIPETLTAVNHGARITASLPSGSTATYKTQLTIAESSLSLNPLQAAYTAGGVIGAVISNSGGVDTQTQYKLSLYDAKAALVAESSGTGAAAAGATLALALSIPAGAVDGPYNLVAQFKDMKTGKELIIPNPVSIHGMKAGLQVKTDKEHYLLTETIAGLSTVSTSGSIPLQNGNLHLQVTTAAGEQNIKTWTTQADFQTGVRNGVDTYGVNDWIIPDDDFSGTVINGDRWKSNVYNSGAIPTITGEQLQLDTTGAIASVAEVVSNFHLEGDFDAQVDYEINPFTNYNSHALLVASFDDGSYFRVGRQGSYYQSFKVWPVENRTTSSSDIKGKFRLTRAANVAKTWYWNGAPGINQASWTVSTAPVTIHLQVASHLGTEQVHAKFDNFKVNSGRIKTENQTVDSVRLLPLNDNFDDGVLNADRWNLWGKNVSNETNGVFHLTSDAASVWHGITLRIPLKGNYSAISRYKNFSATADARLGTFHMLAVNGNGNAGYYIHRASDNTSQYIQGRSFVDGGNNSYYFGTPVPYSLDTGIFRLKKAGTTGFADYWDGLKWISVYSDDRMLSDSEHIEIYTLSSQANLPTIKSDVDYFYIDKGNFAANGTLTLRYNSETTNNKWNKLTFSSTQPADTSIKFRTRTADTEAGLANATWSDILTISGADVTSPAGRWIEIEATLSTADANVTPLLHDVSVSYGSNAGEILWQTDVSVNLAQNAVSDLNNAIGTLATAGKYYLKGTLTSGTGQMIATTEYPFFVGQGDMLLSLQPDKKLYKSGETVSLTGEVKNLAAIDAANLTITVKGQPSGAAQQTLYTADTTIPAGGSYPFTVTTTASTEGVVALTGTVSQNGTALAQMSDQYEVVRPQLTATLTAPDTAGNDPFTLGVTITNSGKTVAVVTVNTSFGSQPETVTVPSGETRILQYSSQITADTIFTFTLGGDLNQTLTKTVAYLAVPVINGVIDVKVVADKISYTPNAQVSITATVTGTGSNAIFNNLVVKTMVFGSTSQSLFNDTRTIATLASGQRSEIKNYWNTADNPKGTYTVRIEVLNGSTSIGSAQSTFAISGNADNNGGLTGSITAQPGVVEAGVDETLSFGIANIGNESITEVSLQMLVVDPDSGQALKTMSALSGTLSLAVNANRTGQVSFSTVDLPLKPLLAILQSSASGITKTVASATFTVTDTTLPVLVISTLHDGTYTNNETLNIAGTVHDNSGVKELRINDTNVPVNSDGSFSHALLLKTGDNLIQTVVTDLGANQTTDSRTIRLDQVAPELTITAPADNSQTAQAALQLSGTVNETATVSVKLADAEQPVSMDSNGFSAQLILTPGINTIQVTAVDLAGNSSSLKRTVIYDDQKPSLSVTVPIQDIRTNKADLTISGTVADPYTAVSVSITVDGITYTPAVVEGRFEQAITLTTEKNYAIVVTATNEAGTSTVVQRNVIYDTTPPGFAINPVVSPTQTAEQIISGTREAGSTVTVTCSTAVVGTVEYPDSTTWQVGITHLTSGDNLLTAVATDETGNSSSQTARITYSPQSTEPLFNYAVFGNSGISVTGGALTDSYRGDSFRRNSLGNVGTNATQPCALKLLGAAIVRGKALVGNGGNPSQGICITGLAVANGTGVLEQPKPMQPASDPGGGQNMGSLSLSGIKTRTLSEGTYRFSSISLSGASKLTVTGKTTIIVNGTLSITGLSKIEIPSDASLTVYLNGKSLNISGVSLLNRSQQPQRLLIYGTAALKTIKLSGLASLHGLIYAPMSDITITGTLQLYGSVIGNSVTLDGASAVHFDETLLEN